MVIEKRDNMARHPAHFCNIWGTGTAKYNKIALIPACTLNQSPKAMIADHKPGDTHPTFCVISKLSTLSLADDLVDFRIQQERGGGLSK